LGLSLIKNGLLEDAVQKAKSAEVVVLCLGTYDYIESEGKDRASLNLPENQIVLMKNIYEVNKNIVLVLINGSSISLPWASENIPSIIEAWYPGQSGGSAIAEVLFGYFNPGGKLPITFYKGINQLPPFDDYDIRKGRTYMYLEDEPLYPFGYGLSYTSFEVRNIYCKEKKLSKEDTIKVNFEIINNGDREGSEVVQLYVENGGVKKLKDFKRIFLNVHEPLSSILKVPISELKVWDEYTERYVIDSGTYTINLGTNSQEFFFSETIEIK